MVTKIPIANLYYLLCYAWNSLEEGEAIDVKSLGGADTVNLLAQLLVTGVRQAMRRGLNRDYFNRAEELAGIRGRILFAESSRRLLLQHGRAMCSFDELDYNNLPNQILKASLETFLHAETLSATNREAIGSALRELRGVEAADLHPAIFRRVRLHRSNAHYGMLLSICELSFDCLLPDRGDGVHRFKSFVEDHDLMATIYEDFVRNFYCVHAPEHGYTSVGSPAVKWVVSFEDKGSEEALPVMLTDVVLKSPTRKIILDCKFYHNALNERFGREKLNSSNLYQIFAYVKNQRKVPGWDACEGLLLYPAVDSNFSYTFNMDGNRIRAATVDLAKPWTEIRDQLLALI